MPQQSEDDQLREEVLTGNKAEKNVPAAARQEAVSSMSSIRSFRDSLRASTVAFLTALDGSNPPSVTSQVRDTASGAADKSKGGDKPKVSADVNQHNQEVLNLLLNADSIIAKHHRSADGLAQNNRTQGTETQSRESRAVSEIRTSKTSTNPVPSRDAADELARKEQESKQAELQKQAQRERLRAAIEAGLIADVRNRKDGPEVFEVSTPESALEARRAAEERNVPLLVDVYGTRCGPCKQMDAEALSYLEGRNNSANKPTVEAVYVHIDGDRAQAGTMEVLNIGSVRAYPHVAIFKPGNYSRPSFEQEGQLGYNQLFSLLQND